MAVSNVTKITATDSRLTTTYTLSFVDKHGVSVVLEGQGTLEQVVRVYDFAYQRADPAIQKRVIGLRKQVESAGASTLTATG